MRAPDDSRARLPQRGDEAGGLGVLEDHYIIRPDEFPDVTQINRRPAQGASPSSAAIEQGYTATQTSA
jgi:hypothetical protein